MPARLGVKIKIWSLDLVLDLVTLGVYVDLHQLDQVPARSSTRSQALLFLVVIIIKDNKRE